MAVSSDVGRLRQRYDAVNDSVSSGQELSFDGGEALTAIAIFLAGTLLGSLTTITILALIGINDRDD